MLAIFTFWPIVTSRNHDSRLPDAHSAHIHLGVHSQSLNIQKLNDATPSTMSLGPTH